jgi:hypothetical protein
MPRPRTRPLTRPRTQQGGKQGGRRAFTRAYRRVRLWIRRHGAWPAEREVRACDRVAFECLYQRQVAVMDGRR